MEIEERLQKLDNDKLLDVVKNHKRYGYDADIRDVAIHILNQRGYSIDELRMCGLLKNSDYDEAEKQYNAFRTNSKIAYSILIFSGGILFIVYLIFVYAAYLNQNNFYRALGRENDNTFMTDIFGIMLYFHVRDKMKEELKGIR